MSTFDSWRTPAGSASSPRGPALPPRRAASMLDDLRDQARENASSQRSSAAVYATFQDLLTTRVDRPFYTGIEGRAAVCLLLPAGTPESRDDLAAVVANGANLHVIPLPLDHPLLRMVLVLPPPLGSIHESLLDLGEGDVQEFVTDALATGTVELHIMAPDVDAALGLRCRAHGLAVLERAVEDLGRRDHPSDRSRFRAAVDEASRAYPGLGDGLSRETAVILQPTGTVSGFVTVDMAF